LLASEDVHWHSEVRNGNFPAAASFLAQIISRKLSYAIFAESHEELATPQSSRLDKPPQTCPREKRMLSLSSRLWTRQVAQGCEMPEKVKFSYHGILYTCPALSSCEYLIAECLFTILTPSPYSSASSATWQLYQNW
jgi:hypothetical protein